MNLDRTRSKVSTVRLDSEILYLARVAALARRISVRSWLEEAIIEKLSDRNDSQIPSDDEITREILLHAEDEDEMREMWHKNGHADIIGEEYLEEAIESTKTIANRCNARLDVETLKEPKFTVPNGYKNKHIFYHVKHSILHEKAYHKYPTRWILNKKVMKKFCKIII